MQRDLGLAGMTHAWHSTGTEPMRCPTLACVSSFGSGLKALLSLFPDGKGLKIYPDSIISTL